MVSFFVRFFYKPQLGSAVPKQRTFNRSFAEQPWHAWPAYQRRFRRENHALLWVSHVNSLLLKMAIEIVSFPIKNGDVP